MIKVLVVDDDTEVMELVIQTLGQLKTELEIDTACTGADAWGKLKKFSPDLLILDLKLPGIYGTEICKKLRLRKMDNKTKILILTSYLTPDVHKMVMNSGADHCLQKPFDPEVLRQVVEKLLKTVNQLNEI